MLSDRVIKGEIAKGRAIIEPLNPDCVQPASVDLHLDKNPFVFKDWRHQSDIDVKQNMDDITDLIDFGWCGHLTLELFNVVKLPVTLYYRRAIGQVSFLRLTSPVERFYDLAGLSSKYQGQTEPTASRYMRAVLRGSSC